MGKAILRSLWVVSCYGNPNLGHFGPVVRVPNLHTELHLDGGGRGGGVLNTVLYPGMLVPEVQGTYPFVSPRMINLLRLFSFLIHVVMRKKRQKKPFG